MTLCVLAHTLALINFTTIALWNDFVQKKRQQQRGRQTSTIDWIWNKNWPQIVVEKKTKAQYVAHTLNRQGERDRASTLPVYIDALAFCKQKKMNKNSKAREWEENRGIIVLASANVNFARQARHALCCSVNTTLRTLSTHTHARTLSVCMHIYVYRQTIKQPTRKTHETEKKTGVQQQKQFTTNFALIRSFSPYTQNFVDSYYSIVRLYV